MLRSMTGFGTATGEVQGVEFSVEIRSVNNRYLKLSMRLPESLQLLETKIDQLVRKHLQRGSVNLNVRMNSIEKRMSSIESRFNEIESGAEDYDSDNPKDTFEELLRSFEEELNKFSIRLTQLEKSLTL